MVPYAARWSVFVVLAAGLQSQIPAAPGGAAARPAVTAEQQVRALVTGLQANDAEALWDFLPPSWQKDLDGLVHELAGKVDPAVYKQGASVMARLGEIAQTKREFLLGSPLARQAGPNASIGTAIDALGIVLRTLADSDLGTHRGLQQFNGRKFCESTGSTLLKELLACGDGKPAAELQRLRVRGIRQDKSTATVAITGTGKAETEDYRLVEGRWLPVKFADRWASAIKEARAAVQELPDGGDKQKMLQARSGLSMIEGVLKRVEDAETQAEFDQAIAPLMQMAGGGTRRNARK